MKKLLVFKLFDYVLFSCVIILVGIGILFIYSSSVNAQGVSVSNEYIRQIIFAISGIFLMMLCAVFDYRKYMRFIPTLFGLYIFVLLLTLVFGRVVNGAKSWIGIGAFSLQPSELGKIAFILFFAWFLDKSQNMAPFKRFIYAGITVGIPFCLILIQPDMGTSSVYLPIFLAMAFVAGISLRYLLFLITIGVGTILFTLLPIINTEILNDTIPFARVLTNTKLLLIIIAGLVAITVVGIVGYVLYKKKFYYWLSWAFAALTMCFVGSVAAGVVLKEYQIMRLIVFLNPDIDPLGSGWNIIQSKIAIGSGGAFGQGVLQGTQSHLRFLPQQSTDFIFSIIAEEIGFFGVFFIFTLFGIFFFRIIHIMKNTKNRYGYYIVAGIFAMFFFHFMVNVGVAMGLMPITGIPLFFLSYGGSSLWTAMISVGLLKNIYFRRLDYNEY